MRFSEEEQEQRAAEIIDHLKTMWKVEEGVSVAIRPGDLLLVTVPAIGDHKPSQTRETPCVGKGRDMVDNEVALNKNLLPFRENPTELWPRGDMRGVMFEFVEKVDDTDLHARGGRQVFGGGYQCTSGFSVYR